LPRALLQATPPFPLETPPHQFPRVVEPAMAPLADLGVGAPAAEAVDAAIEDAPLRHAPPAAHLPPLPVEALSSDGHGAPSASHEGSAPAVSVGATLAGPTTAPAAVDGLGAPREPGSSRAEIDATLPPITIACLPPGLEPQPGDILLFFDGACPNNGTCSRSNPAHVGWGFALCDHTLRLLRQGGGYEGSCINRNQRTHTNNVAEYRSLQAGLDAVLQLHLHQSPDSRRLLILGDSALVCTQLAGTATARGPLSGLLAETQAYVAAMAPLCPSYHHIFRTSNQRADALANAAILRRCGYVWDHTDDARAMTDWSQQPLCPVNRRVSHTPQPALLSQDLDSLCSRLDQCLAAATAHVPPTAAAVERVLVENLSLATLNYQRDFSAPRGTIFVWASRQFSQQASRPVAATSAAVLRASLPPGPVVRSSL
jgi:ribonuclease HI